MLINRDGRFKARISKQGIDETGQNKLVTFTARFALEQEYRDGEWHDLATEKAEITGYFYLEKKDGSLNTRTIESLCESLGWDGRDPFWLQDTDLGDRLVQLTIALETYENKTRPKVKWINHEHAEPTQGVQRADGAARTAIANRLVSKLRAHAGGTPRTAPAPTSPKPAAPVPKPPAAAAPSASTADEAWTGFTAACPPDLPDAERERQWFRILAELFPGKDVAQLTAAQWKQVAEEAPRRIVPF